MLRQAEELDWMEDLYHAARELQAMGVPDRRIRSVVNQALKPGAPRMPELRERVQPGS